MIDMFRSACKITLQHQTGYFVRCWFLSAIKDKLTLLKKGLYVYGITQCKNGDLQQIEDKLDVFNCCGYVVFKQPVKFPERKNIENPDKAVPYFCLNNQWSHVDPEVELINIMEALDVKDDANVQG